VATAPDESGFRGMTITPGIGVEGGGLKDVGTTITMVEEDAADGVEFGVDEEVVVTEVEDEGVSLGEEEPVLLLLLVDGGGDDIGDDAGDDCNVDGLSSEDEDVAVVDDDEDKEDEAFVVLEELTDCSVFPSNVPPLYSIKSGAPFKGFAEVCKTFGVANVVISVVNCPILLP